MPFDCENSPTSVCATTIWLSACRAAGRSPATILSYTLAVRGLREWSGLDDLSGVTRLMAMSYAKHLSERYTPGGAAVRIRALRAGWGWMTAEDLVPTNVFARLRISVPETPQRTATEAEIEAMLASAKRNRRDYALLTLLVDSGCRKAELAGVEVSDVDLTSGTVRFRVSKTRARTVPLTGRAGVAGQEPEYRLTLPHIVRMLIADQDRPLRRRDHDSLL